MTQSRVVAIHLLWPEGARSGCIRTNLLLDCTASLAANPENRI